MSRKTPHPYFDTKWLPTRKHNMPIRICDQNEYYGYHIVFEKSRALQDMPSSISIEYEIISGRKKNKRVNFIIDYSTLPKLHSFKNRLGYKIEQPYKIPKIVFYGKNELKNMTMILNGMGYNVHEK